VQDALTVADQKGHLQQLAMTPQAIQQQNTYQYLQETSPQNILTRVLLLLMLDK